MSDVSAKTKNKKKWTSIDQWLVQNSCTRKFKGTFKNELILILKSNGEPRSGLSRKFRSHTPVDLITHGGSK